MNEIQFFKNILEQQLEVDTENINHFIDIEDPMLEDVSAMTGEYAPKVKDLGNGTMEVVVKTSAMMSYGGGEVSGVIKTNPVWSKATVSHRYLRAAFELTHPQLLALKKGPTGAAVDAAEMYIQDIKSAIVRGKSRALRGDGKGISGVLPDGIQVGQTITISGRERGAPSTHNFYGLGTDELFVGEPLVFGTDDDLINGTGKVGIIESLPSETEIKLKATVTVGNVAGANNRGGTNADTVYIVRGDNIENEYNKLPHGIFALIDDGTFVPTFMGKDRSTEAYMRSAYMRKASSATILKDFRKLYMLNKKYSKGAYFRCAEDVYEDYTDALTAQLKTEVPIDYKSGLKETHSGLAFQYAGSKDIPIMLDMFYPAGFTVIVNPKCMFEAELFAPGWLPEYMMSKKQYVDTNGKMPVGVYETIMVTYYDNATSGSRALGSKMSYDS